MPSCVFTSAFRSSVVQLSQFLSIFQSSFAQRKCCLKAFAVNLGQFSGDLILVHVFLQKLSGTTSQLSARFKRWNTVDTLNIALHHETVTE
jgi:hypothetical protein